MVQRQDCSFSQNISWWLTVFSQNQKLVLFWNAFVKVFAQQTTEKGQPLQGKQFRPQQDTVVLWSSASCIRLGGRRFESCLHQKSFGWKMKIGCKMKQRSKAIGWKMKQWLETTVWNKGRVGWKHDSNWEFQVVAPSNINCGII